MSEHQCVAFRAIDGPVTEKNLEYMRRQSSRAEVTAWSFDNEYHFGDFRGDAEEMLRRGYDLHLHYANFGVRKLLIRLPHGLPDPKAAEPYFGEDSLKILHDKKGPGGIIVVQPSHEPGDLEDLWEFDDLVDRLVPLRAEILDGDLRPLYLAHLAVASGSYHYPEETKEAPVPAGLEKVTAAQRALMELYGLSDALIAAAAQGAPRLTAHSDSQDQYMEWLRGLPQTTKDAWLSQTLTDPNSGIRREMLGEFQKSRRAPSWPTVRLDRTIAELEAAAERIQHGANQKAAAKAASQRAKRLIGLAADPQQTLRETEKLVAQRGTDSYAQAVTLLADLREALADTKQSGVAEQQAQKFKSQNPKLTRLISELRRRGFLSN